jgi:general L-amino acid transport system permease protein
MAAENMIEPTQTNELRPEEKLSIAAWAQKNLFSPWYNSLLTALGAILIVMLLKEAVPFLLNAQWPAVTTNIQILLVGQYPSDELWRVGAGVLPLPFIVGIAWGVWGSMMRTFSVILVVASILTVISSLFGDSMGSGFVLWFTVSPLLVFLGYAIGRRDFVGPRQVLIAWFLFLLLTLFLLRGFGEDSAMPYVPTDRWGGLLVTILIAQVGIAVVLPLGIVLALARQSNLWFFKGAAIAYIEVLRATPLLALLFLMLIVSPMFLPDVTTPDRLMLAFIAIVLNNSAYMAENIRGGLQSVSRGQVEAAQALGMRGSHVTLVIVLPQAIRATIPAIVGQFIILFKDTAVIALVGLMDLLGAAYAIILGQDAWRTADPEVFLFVAAVYWIFTYGMSSVSAGVEKRMRAGAD